MDALVGEMGKPNLATASRRWRRSIEGVAGMCEAAPMRVLCLDYDLGAGEDHYRFGSSVSLFDYDVVFWDPAQSLEGYKALRDTYQGRDSLNDNASARLVNDVHRRNSEFKDFLEMGRCLVIFLPGDLDVWVDTGKKDYSGTGRNRAATRIVDRFNILKAIPLDLTFAPGSGLEITPANDIMASLFKQSRESWIYRSVIEKHQTVKPLLHIKGTKKSVAGMVRVKGAGGRLILLPELVLPFADDESDGDADDLDLVETGSPEDSGVATQAEEDEDEPWPGDLLLAWVESLVAEPDASLPSWTAEYKFPTEARRSAEQVALEAELSELQVRIESLNAEQARDEQWKTLIAGSGASLERRVREAFELVGFTFEQVDPGRSDLKGEYQGRRVVVEVKGLSKSAAEKNAAQLEKWVSEELAEEREVKGVLVVNTWRELPVASRTEADFPNQMLKYCEQRGHCLLTGLQLLSMVRACLDSPDRKSEIASLVLDTVGPVENWSDLASIFVPREGQAESAQLSVDEPESSLQGEVVDPTESQGADPD
ncbi:hypothetical protein ACFPJ1_29470 [Kribbella qitaiheensis]|uniref:hypothetical protein n=1 Tax=Kribbella qitaiheensis TaxID=1544730 RepID=UPI00360B789A